MSKLGPALAALLVLSLVACGSTTGSDTAATAPAQAPAASPTAVEAFLAYAEGRDPDVPWAATVHFSIAGEEVAQLAPPFADQRASWVRCPDGVTEYEGRECPVSPLNTLWLLHRDDHDVVLETTGPETVGCTRYRTPWENADTVWIRPEEDRRDCFTDFAIALAVDEAGDVVAVDLALSGP